MNQLHILIYINTDGSWNHAEEKLGMKLRLQIQYLPLKWDHTEDLL